MYNVGVTQISLILIIILGILVLAILAGVGFFRWLIFRPIASIARSLREIRSGKTSAEFGALKRFLFFSPLITEISKIGVSLRRARTAAMEEAKMRYEKLESPWTAERLGEFIKAYLKDRNIFVVSATEPYVHDKPSHWYVPASGMVTAVESVMQACGGLWVALGRGEADKESSDNEGKLKVPPDDPKYTLKRMWITPEEYKGFYVGFANEAMWPLFHNAHTRPIFRKEDWQKYRRVNGKFTEALLAEIKDIDRPIILVQDFHFALLPEMIKKNRPDAQIGIFWHVPWPSPETFNICPWAKQILQGMLGADIIGFHTQQYCNNFMETVGRGIESIIDLDQFSITFKNHLTQIRPFPISIAFPELSAEAEKNSANKIFEQFGIKTEYVGMGVERLDYIKGILERFKGIEFFFDQHPNNKEKFTFLQIAEPSREAVERYRQFNKDVTSEAERINQKFATNSWQPIVLEKRHFSHEELYPLYRHANVCLVTSLHDGMNLVSKEFVAARDDEKGVLVLSQFAGAARELKGGAIIINPYSAEETAAAINEALNMPLIQQRRRMKKMREAVRNYNVYRWSAEFLRALINLD